MGKPLITAVRTRAGKLWQWHAWFVVYKEQNVFCTRTRPMTNIKSDSSIQLRITKWHMIPQTHCNGNYGVPENASILHCFTSLFILLCSFSSFGLFTFVRTKLRGQYNLRRSLFFVSITKMQAHYNRCLLGTKSNSCIPYGIYTHT